MKNKFLLAPALFFTAMAGAQTTTPTTTPAPTQPVQNSTTVPATATTEVATTAYVANSEQLKGLTSESLKPEHFFPVLGSYQASGSSTGNVTITLDETNKGIVWVEGLSQGKFKAVMKKAPATYKIPAQKTESGKSVTEGTLFFNPTSRELTIVLGRAFNDDDPASSLTIEAKTKSKAWQYTGVKTDVAVAVEPSSKQ